MESETRRLALDQCPLPIEILDSEGVVQYVNEAFQTWFGVEPSELVGRKSSSLALSSGPLDWWLSAKASAFWRGEFESLREKTPFTDTITVFPVKHPERTEEEFVVIHADTSEEKRLAERLKKEQGVLLVRSRQAQMGELISLIAHQWRQPLSLINSLVGNVQLKMELGALDGEYLKYKLDKVTETVQTLSQTIDAFRGFYTVLKSPCKEDLRRLVRRALDLLGSGFQKRGIRVDCSLPDDEVVVLGFAGELLQALIEILHNAGDAFAERDVRDPRIVVNCKAENGTATVVLANNAGSIPAEACSEIFEPYFSTKTPDAGSGLGLYMAKLIVEEHHGGRLSVNCSSDWTEFTLTLQQAGDAF